MAQQVRGGYEKLRAEVRRWFAANLRAERQRLGLTQEQAAELVGFSLQYLQRIERQVVNVPLDTVARFAHAYEVDPSQLLRAVAGEPDTEARSRPRGRLPRGSAGVSRR